MTEEQEIYKSISCSDKPGYIILFWEKKLLISVFLEMTRKIKVSYSNKGFMGIMKAGFSILSIFSYFML